MANPSPPPSRTPSGRSARPSLSLDLSNLPPVHTPTPPSNTLLITNLADPAVFRPDNLQALRDLVQKTAPVHSWAPLKSFRRIVVSFWSEDAAIRVRSAWDGESVLGSRCRVYFGQPTPLDYADKAQQSRLALPDAGKLFFISPPPSPPHDWEMRLEDAPNKQVHADDLADALSRLRHDKAASAAAQDLANPQQATPTTPARSNTNPTTTTRSRSSTLIFHPDDNGSSPQLPAIAVEDMTDEPDVISPMDEDSPVAVATAATKPIMAHTARPPVELMNMD